MKIQLSFCERVSGFARHTLYGGSVSTARKALKRNEYAIGRRVALPHLARSQGRKEYFT